MRWEIKKTGPSDNSYPICTQYIFHLAVWNMVSSLFSPKRLQSDCKISASHSVHTFDQSLHLPQPPPHRVELARSTVHQHGQPKAPSAQRNRNTTHALVKRRSYPYTLTRTPRVWRRASNKAISKWSIFTPPSVGHLISTGPQFQWGAETARAPTRCTQPGTEIIILASVHRAKAKANPATDLAKAWISGQKPNSTAFKTYIRPLEVTVAWSHGKGRSHQCSAHSRRQSVWCPWKVIASRSVGRKCHEPCQFASVICFNNSSHGVLCEGQVRQRHQAD